MAEHDFLYALGICIGCKRCGRSQEQIMDEGLACEGAPPDAWLPYGRYRRTSKLFTWSPEPQADGATAPRPSDMADAMAYALGKPLWIGIDEAADVRPGFWESKADNPPAKPPGKAIHTVPSIGRALEQTNRPATLCGALLRYRGRE